MIIECIIKREGATTVSINGFRYTFAANSDHAKVSAVNSTEHQQWLLSFPTCYREYMPVEKKADPELLQETFPAILPETSPVPEVCVIGMDLAAGQDEGCISPPVQIPSSTALTKEVNPQVKRRPPVPQSGSRKTVSAPPRGGRKR